MCDLNIYSLTNDSWDPSQESLSSDLKDLLVELGVSLALLGITTLVIRHQIKRNDRIFKRVKEVIGKRVLNSSPEDAAKYYFDLLRDFFSRNKQYAVAYDNVAKTQLSEILRTSVVNGVQVDPDTVLKKTKIDGFDMIIGTKRISIDNSERLAFIAVPIKNGHGNEVVGIDLTEATYLFIYNNQPQY